MQRSVWPLPSALPGESPRNAAPDPERPFRRRGRLVHPVVENPKYPPLRVTQSYIDRLEGWCDELNEQLAPLNSFILPGGTALGALLHVARTVSRRAERAAWSAINANPEDTSVLPAKYLNRLSDLLFIMGRVANPEGDVLWKPGAGA